LLSIRKIFFIYLQNSFYIQRGDDNLTEIEEESHNGTVGLLKGIFTDSPIGIEIYDSKGKLIDLN